MATAYTPDRLRNLFQSSFDMVQWYDFLQHLFKASELKEKPERIIQNTSDEGYYLGTIDTADSFRIGLFHYYILQGSVANKRVGLRNLVKSFINPNWGEFDAALVVFDSDDHWRLSFICDIKGEATSPKRYTYVFGDNDSLYKTPVERFDFLQKKGISFENLKEAFSVEALSKEFFDKYRKHYADFVEYITGKQYVKSTKGWIEKQTHEPHPQLQEQFFGDEKRVRDYIKKLLGRIVFLHYLQRKGWLGVPQNKSWGEGDTDFMRHLFEYATEEQRADFIEEILEPLFYDALNTNRGSDGDLFDTQVEFPKVGTSLRIPYLNGGLFEADENDKLTVQFPSVYFKNLLDFFSQYNFTIDENDPSDAQVGVDPEMLGRIFESLLEDNKDKGAFYTPKEIVQYMCRESLIAYLQTDQREEDKDCIRQFVLTHDAVLLGDLKGDINQRLCDVKICDPAIGSGAFPMGLLRELFFCRSAINPNIVGNATNIKRHIIQNNIYGVDIERGAVDIARLRFWLSLIVDEASPETLPNLDFKIMQGNSLLEQHKGVDLSTMTEKKVGTGQGMTIFDSMLDVYRKELRDKLAEYYACPEHDKKIQLRKDIADIVKQELIEQGIQIDFEDLDLSANGEFFLWHTWFHDVFSRPSKEGFDIVIGNPPYGAKYDNQTKRYYKNTYVTANSICGLQKGSLDTYTMFIELGYYLLKQNGSFAYIVPISLTSSDSLTGVHRLLVNNCDTIHISSYAVRPKPVFENAVVNTSILLFQKTETPCQHLYSTKMHRRGNEFDLQKLVDNLNFVDVNGYTMTGRIPKIGCEMEKNILTKVFNNIPIKSLDDDNGEPIYYRTTGGRYFKVVTNYPTGSTKEKPLYLQKQLTNAIGCILSSSLSFWFYQIYSNNLDWKTYEIENFTIPQLSTKDVEYLDKLYSRYLTDIEAKANVRKTSGESTYNVDSFKEYKIVRSKPIIDEIDDYICPLYNLTQEETDFIKNYELEFRLAGE
ncbi:Eco57I restriction-modification methylase domain-containing protein [Porphyromonas loveana]